MGLFLKKICLETQNLSELVSFVGGLLDWEVKKDELTGGSFCEYNTIRLEFVEISQSRTRKNSELVFEIDCPKEFSEFEQKIDFFKYRNPKIKLKIERTQKEILITDKDKRSWSFQLRESATITSSAQEVVIGHKMH